MRFSTTVALSSALLAPLALAQSSSVISAEPSAASAASSAVASAAPSGAGGNGTDYLTTVLAALTQAGLTSLVDVATSIAGTPEGQALLGSLAVGNKTVFAPNNDAFSGVPESVTGNTTLLTEILSYHILNNTYSASGVNTSPNHTIARTALRGGEYQLPGNRTAPLVLEKESANATSFRIVQAEIVTPQGPAVAANLEVYIIDRVLDLPGNITAVATAAAPQLAGLVQQAGLLEPLENAVGITVFAPTDEAIAAAQSALGSVTNATLVQNVLLNHVINGSAVYSTELGTGNYTSAAGSPFTFSRNDTGVFVTSGNTTAQITASDVIINNGVVHLINAVLLNTESNAEAAEGAYTSATGAAATQTDPTGAITATSQPAQTSGGGAGGASGSATPSGAAGRLQPMGLSGSMVGGALAVLASVVGGAFILL